MSPSDSLLVEVPLTTTIPTDAQVPYTPPSIPTLLSMSAFLVLLAMPTLLSNSYPVFAYQQGTPPDLDAYTANNDSKRSTKSQVHSYTLDTSLTIIFPLLLGALFGPSITSNSILSTSTQSTLINIGYLGLILLIFEAGVSLDAASLKLMRDNAALSTLAALTGALVPIALSMGLGLGAYGYTGLQAFASGASLASTSLGTTLALLAPPSASTMRKSGSGSDNEGVPSAAGMDLRRTRVGCILVCAALLDDILGLVIAGIIPGLAQTDSGGESNVNWPIIVRPVLVSVAFGFGTPLAAMALRWVLNRFFARRTPRPQFMFILIILTLMAFIACSGYAGTSELFGAYLAGAFVSHVFPAQDDAIVVSQMPDDSVNKLGTANSSQDSRIVTQLMHSGNPAHAAFVAYIQPLVTHLLAPLFFASIGVALPIKQMFTTHPDAVQIVSIAPGDNTTTVTIDSGRASHQVVWRGLVYALLMILAKMIVGFWMFLWPDPNSKHPKKRTQSRTNPSSSVAVAGGDIESTQRRLSIGRRLIQKVQQGRQANRDPAPNTQEAPILRAPTPSNEPTRMRSALLLGLAMVARGEIALIVAQLARPLLVDTALPSATSTTSSTVTKIPIPDEEPFAVVIWAILLSTVGGAIGVGVLIASWKKEK